MRMIFQSAVLSFALLLNTGCSDGEKMMLSDINETKAADVRVLIANDLRVGSTSSEIENFLKRNKINYSYDRFSKRYQGIIRDVSDNKNIDQAVTIYIFVDEEKSFKSSEVRDSFTAP